MTYGIPWNREAEAFPVGTFVRPNERYSELSEGIGRVVGTRGRTVAVRFPAHVFARMYPYGAFNVPAEFAGKNVGAYDADWLHRVVYVRAESFGPGMMPGRSEFHGARVVVRERYLPRRQRTYPFPYEHGGMFGSNAKAYCVGEFARTVLGMMRPDVTEAYERGRVTMFVVTERGTCDCTDEYGPCEFHAETIVTREGSASRSADELAHEFLTDTASVLHAWPSDAFEAATVRLGNALADSGGTWFDNPDDADELRDHVTTAEGALAAAGYSTYWDDGYRIVRITGGPFHDAP